MHIIFTSWSLESANNVRVSCILMYFGVVECCIPILFLGLHVAQLTQSLLCFTAQASCWRSPGGLHNSFRHKWPPNRLKELFHPNGKNATLNLPIRHVLRMQWFHWVQVQKTQWDWLTPLDSLQVSSGHSLNEMDWWFHEPKKQSTTAAVRVFFFQTMCPPLWRVSKFRSIERGLPIILWLSRDQLTTLLSLLLPGFSVDCLVYLAQKHGRVCSGSCEKKCRLPSSRWNCPMAP